LARTVSSGLMMSGGPYSFQTLLGLDAAALRALVDAATMALLHKHVAEGGDGVKRGLEEEEEGEEGDGGDNKTRKRAATTTTTTTEEMNKAMEMRASEVAGDYALAFGKHKGVPIRRVDMSYLTWVLGFKRKGQKFERLPESGGMDWVKENQPVALGEIRKYLTWRCWVCRSTDVRFPSARLCRSCFISGDGGRGH